MYQTIRLSSCVSVYGEFVRNLQNGDVMVRDGSSIYRGKPIARSGVGASALNAGIHACDAQIRCAGE